MPDGLVETAAIGYQSRHVDVPDPWRVVVAGLLRRPARDLFQDAMRKGRRGDRAAFFVSTPFSPVPQQWKTGAPRKRR
jgi:hypothetical protein